jgi:hypothetical protein
MLTAERRSFVSLSETLADAIGVKSEALAPFLRDKLCPYVDNMLAAQGTLDFFARKGADASVITNFFIGLSRGIQVAYEQYGTTMEHLRITNNIIGRDGKALTFALIYSPVKDELLIHPGIFARYRRDIETKSKRYNYHLKRDVTPDEQIRLLGFEEAFHAHQEKKLRTHAIGRQSYVGSTDAEYYENDPFEQEAGRAVQAAAAKLGLDNSPEMQR